MLSLLPKPHSEAERHHPRAVSAVRVFEEDEMSKRVIRCDYASKGWLRGFRLEVSDIIGILIIVFVMAVQW